MQRTTWLKLGVAALLVVGLPWLFLRTVQDTIAEPYDIDPEALSGWTLATHETRQPAPAVITLLPPAGLVPDLFQQIFRRTMESMTTSARPAMPVVLQSEFSASLREVLSPEDIMEAARESGLEDARFGPVCMAVKREPSGGRTRQLYFVVFEAPAFTQFRQELARLYAEGGGTAPFDPTALELVLPVASSDVDFAGWWPLEVDREVDCRAKLRVNSESAQVRPRRIPLRPGTPSAVVCAGPSGCAITWVRRTCGSG